MKFEKIEQFTEMKARRDRGYNELARREEAAAEEITRLKAEYESVLRESLVAGTDSTKALDALQDKIDAATKLHVRRQQERALYSTVVKPEISEAEVVSQWVTEYKPAFIREKINPALERLLDAKIAAVAAYLDFLDTVKQYDAEAAYVVGEIGDSYRYKLGSVGFDNRTERELHTITDQTLFWLSQGDKVPGDVIDAISRKDTRGLPINETDARLAQRAATREPGNTRYQILAEKLKKAVSK
ncbi:hypothetical protein J2T17_004690 [Paenibacillus mucilaginosus]|uniref:hypothetical protein n=1 Tax=Paenibacillus mucilaginosus TaxID=61624 RepID=UPI003D253B7C